MCQVHRADQRDHPILVAQQAGRKALLIRAAGKITKDQCRIIRARNSHIKKTRRKLRSLGIKLTKVPKCRWDTS